MSIPKIFPQGIATGNAFINRTLIRSRLKTSILANEHTVITSPRRYGKTSLITQVISEGQFPSCHIDLLLTSSDAFVKNAILSGVEEITTQLLPKHKKFAKKIFELLANFSPKLVVTAFGQKMELHSPEPPQKSIVDVLKQLDEIACLLKKRVVFVMDEFQQISKIDNYQVVEASIRHAVERSKNITYIFSGSNRHLLAGMFNDENRPLYHLCELVKLGRISADDYKEYIISAAKQHWLKPFSDDAIETLLGLTKCHSYYVNLLCRKIWKKDSPPTAEKIEEIWKYYVYNQQPWIIGDLAKLTANQRAILVALAHKPTNTPNSKAFVSATGLTPASITKAINSLTKKDLTLLDKQGFHQILDPVIYYYIVFNKVIRSGAHDNIEAF